MSLLPGHRPSHLSNGTRTYKLAPYRLATVAGGCFVAFIWTVFPKPLTDRTWLRRDLSAALYLLSNYFGVITSTVRSQIEGTAGDPDVPHSPAHELQKIRRKIFGKMMLLLPSMAAHAQWQRWEPTIGGRFPREAYEDIIMRTTRIMSYLTFMSYTMNHPPAEHLEALRGRRRDLDPQQQQQQQQPSSSSASSPPPQGDEQPTPGSGANDRDWLDALASVLHEISPSHHNIVSTLMLLSNALFSGHSLPPFLPLPRPYEMTRALLRLSRSAAPATSPPSSSSPRAEKDDEEEDEEEEEEEEEEPDLSPLMVIDSRTGRAVEDSVRRRPSAPLRPVRVGKEGRQHVLDAENVEKPGYAEFAVLEICSTLVCDDLEGLIRSIAGLVGVVDFSYRVGGSSGSTLGGGGDWGKGGKGKVD